MTDRDVSRTLRLNGSQAVSQLAAKGRTDPLAYLLFAFDCITEALSNTIRDVSQNVPDQ